MLYIILYYIMTNQLQTQPNYGGGSSNGGGSHGHGHGDKDDDDKKIILYIKKTKNPTYTTKYGIQFECVELIRRFFCIHKGLTFPDVDDAVDLFKRIHEFTPVSASSSPKRAPSASTAATITPTALQTYEYPYQYKASHYLRPGVILFWKYKKPDFPYGHVAIIWKSNANETVIVQQNLNPPIKTYNTTELFEKMNTRTSRFAGVKILPSYVISGVQNIECCVKRL
jgi:hypothetical protein